MPIKQLPRFSTLQLNYPSKNKYDTKALLDGIGGKVRKSFRDSVNTCVFASAGA